VTPSSNSPGSTTNSRPGESARGPHENTSLVGVPPSNPLAGVCSWCDVMYRRGVAPVSHGACWTHMTIWRMKPRLVAEVSEEFTR